MDRILWQMNILRFFTWWNLMPLSYGGRYCVALCWFSTPHPALYWQNKTKAFHEGESF